MKSQTGTFLKGQNREKKTQNINHLHLSVNASHTGSSDPAWELEVSRSFF